MSTKNLANTNLIKHSLRSHTALGRALTRASHAAQRVVLRFRGFGLHNPAYCCQPWPASPLLYTGMGTSVAVAQRQRLSFARAWQRVIVHLGPLMVMSFLSARNPERPLEIWLLSSYAMPQVAETQGRGDDERGVFWCAKSKEYHMSGIRKWLHNGSSLLTPFSSPALSPRFC